MHCHRPGRFLLFLLLTGLHIQAFGQRWELVWEEPFEADSLEAAVWNISTGPGGNGGLEVYTGQPENLYLDDGRLYLQPRMEDIGSDAYTSARIDSRRGGNWRYGRMEVSARFPNRPGLRPAVWLLPTLSKFGGQPRSGKLDLVLYQSRQPGRVRGGVQVARDAAAYAVGDEYGLDEGTFADEFHEFVLEWEPDRLAWGVDDSVYFSITPDELDAATGWYRGGWCLWSRVGG